MDFNAAYRAGHAVLVDGTVVDSRAMGTERTNFNGIPHVVSAYVDTLPVSSAPREIDQAEVDRRRSMAPLSAAEREQQRIAYVLAVDNMARTLRETVRQVDGLMADRAIDHNSAVLHKADYDGHIRWHDTHQRELATRLDALERDAAVGRAFRWASFMARLRWIVGL